MLKPSTYDFGAHWPDFRSHRLARGWRWAIGPVFLALAALLCWLIPTGDFLVMPGDAISTASMVKVPSPATKPHEGELLLVTVYSSPANVDEWLFGHVYPHAELLAARTQLPSNTSYERFRHIEEAMMSDSQTTAKVVALRRLGYNVTAHGQGAVVNTVQARSAAAQAGLQKGDLILAIDGQPVDTDQQLIDAVGQLVPGAGVRLTLKPNNSDAERQLQIMLGSRPNQPDKALLGVTSQTYRPSFDFPVQVGIDSRGIIGPSAGLVLTLSIMQALSPRDITHGHNVAATGTIDLQGTVGPVGGVEDKVLAAEGRAEYFLTPKASYEAAKQKARKLKVVEVDSLQQAVDFLESLA